MNVNDELPGRRLWVMKFKFFVWVNFKWNSTLYRPGTFWNSLYKYTYEKMYKKLNLYCFSSHFLLPGSTIDQVLCAAPFFSPTIPPDIRLVYQGLDTWLLLDYLHLAKSLSDYSLSIRFFMSVDNLSTWTLPEFHFTICLIIFLH